MGEPTKAEYDALNNDAAKWHSWSGKMSSAASAAGDLIYEPWPKVAEDLASKYQTVATDTQKLLKGGDKEFEKVSTTLKKVVKAYQDTDADNADRIRKEWQPGAE